MPSDRQWIVSIIAEARKNHDSVTDTVFLLMETLLGGELSEKPLSPKNLSIIAKLLVADMVPTLPDTEAKG